MAFSAYGSQQPTTFNRGQAEDDPNKPKPQDDNQQPTQGPPREGGPSRMAQPQTFAQMQQNGQARPAPPTPLQMQTQSAVSSQLANPSTYGSDAVQNSYNRLSQNIDDDYTLKERATNEQLAKRGLYDSTKAVGALSDLNIGKRSAKTELASQLLDKQAQTASADRANAIAQAMGYDQNQASNQLAQQGLALQGRGLDQSYALGQGNLGVSQGQLALAQTGQQQQYGLANRQLDQSQNQFDKSYGLQAQGQQQQYGLANRQLDQSGQQFGQSLDLQRQQMGQQASQFDKTYGLQSRAQDQNYGLSQQQMALQQALGYGGLDLQKQQLAQSGSQFDRSLAQSGQQFEQQNKLGYDTLNSQAQLGNRGIDASTENARIAAQMQAAALQAALGYAPGKTQMPAPTGGGADTTPTMPSAEQFQGAVMDPIEAARARMRAQLAAQSSSYSAYDPNGTYARSY